MIPALSVDRENVREAYEAVWHTPALPAVRRALGQMAGVDLAPHEQEAQP